MEMLYHIDLKRFIIKDDEQYYVVSISKNEVIEIDQKESEAILRQGYWQTVNNVDEKIKEACASLIHPI